jgi:hypothetical protein
LVKDGLYPQRDGGGGWASFWDLRTAQGSLVTRGVYLIEASDETHRVVLKFVVR